MFKQNSQKYRICLVLEWHLTWQIIHEPGSQFFTVPVVEFAKTTNTSMTFISTGTKKWTMWVIHFRLGEKRFEN